MITLRVCILILAFVVFALAAIGVQPTKLNLTATGLALWVLASIVG